MSTQDSSTSTTSTREIGDRIEALIAERRGWEHNPDGGDRSDTGDDWYDARGPDGTPIEIKGTVVEQSNGSSNTVGRWWIQRSNHRRLREQRGLYELVVYREHDETEEIEILASCRIPARCLDAFITTWYGTTGSQTQGEATKVPYTRLLGDVADRVGGTCGSDAI